MPDFTVESIVIEECPRPMFKNVLVAYAKKFAEILNENKEENKNND